MKVIGIFILFFMCRIFQNIFTKRTSNNVNGRTQLLTYTAYQYLICMLLSLPAFLLGDLNIPPVPALIASIIGGIAMFASSMCCLMALRSGVLFILTTLFSSISIIIPNTASIFLFGESVGLWQWGGMAALIYAAYLLLGCSRDAYKNFSMKSVMFLLGIFVAEGVTMFSSKCYAAYAPESDVAIYTSLAFGTAFILTGIMGATEMAKAHSSIKTVMNKKLYICGLVLAAMLFVIMYISTIAASLVPAVILYSLASGGSLILALLTAAICFKEPVTKKNVIGLVISIVALVVINAL